MTISDRIKELRISQGLTMEKFGARIGVKRASISLIESGKNNPSDQTILLICREFSINEEWLRTGQGEMHRDIDIDYGSICAEIGITDEKAKKAIINYWNLSPQDKQLVWQFLDRFIHI